MEPARLLEGLLLDRRTSRCDDRSIQEEVEDLLLDDLSKRAPAQFADPADECVDVKRLGPVLPRV